ncbi:HD domain-containing protein [bacterium AH-315-J19]|nr:HD domain-containing protein [Robiginitomaculum sp.]MBN4058521.1 HD domain-containing protein [bacterium AH-315-J19]
MLDDQLAFLTEIDALKGIVRASPIIDKSRRENTAEHSWHLAMYALILGENTRASVNIDRVIKMLLIHDIVEIDAGDTPIHGTQGLTEQVALEEAAADRIFGILPKKQGEALCALWHEFEAANTEDAKFAKALDRLQPLIQNVETGGGTWSESEVTEEQVHERYGPTIQTGSVVLWKKAKELVSKHFSS